MNAANAANRISLKFANALRLNMGDTGAIWRSHNLDNTQAFERLFLLLANNPDTEFQFICAVE